MRGTELNYTTTEKELLAVIFCLEKFRTFLQGTRLVIRTDHQALIFLKKCRLLSERLTSWVLPRGFDSKNGREMAEPLVATFPVEGLRELKREFRGLEEKQKEDPELARIIRAIKEPSETHPIQVLRVTKIL